MTPLAQAIWNDRLQRKGARVFNDRAGMLDLWEDVHCFEVTGIYELALGFNEQVQFSARDEVLGFLPANRTWFEWRHPWGTREAVFLEEVNGGCRVTSCYLRESGHSLAPSGVILPLGAAKSHSEYRRRTLALVEGYGALVPLYGLLALINTPRLIGRRQHVPHAGLQKKMAAAKGMVGKFPLRAWTELKLFVSDIGTRADGTVHEAHYTGERCLHFCRAHLRIRNGQLERVKPHWRGNPALGIKQTRYTVEAAR
jgi:hypothetical protein